MISIHIACDYRRFFCNFHSGKIDHNQNFVQGYQTCIANQQYDYFYTIRYC